MKSRKFYQHHVRPLNVFQTITGEMFGYHLTGYVMVKREANASYND